MWPAANWGTEGGGKDREVWKRARGQERGLADVSFLGEFLKRRRSWRNRKKGAGTGLPELGV